jgi:hypothetical protein
MTMRDGRPAVAGAQKAQKKAEMGEPIIDQICALLDGRSRSDADWD